MRDSLSLRKLGAPGSQRRAHLPEMRDRGRSARGGSPPAQHQRKKSSEPMIERASVRKRTRGGALTHQRGASTSRNFPDRSFSPSPTSRKRRRPNHDERMSLSMRTSDKMKDTAGAAGSSSSTSQDGRKHRGASSSGGVPVAPTRPFSRTREGRSSSRCTTTPATSSVSRQQSLNVVVASPAFDAPPAWPFLEQPQRQTRQRPIDPDKLMKVCVEKSDRDGANTSSNSVRGGKKTPADYREAVQNLARGGRNSSSTMANPSSSKGGRERTSSSRPNSGNSIATSSTSRSRAARSSSSRSSASSSSPGTSANWTPPPVAPTTTSVAAHAPKATATEGGGAGGGRGETESSKTDNVICPQFRLHNLFGSGNSGSSDGEAENASSYQSGSASETSRRSRRKRPVKTAGASHGGGSMPPPRRSASSPGDVGGREAGFLDQTRNALVRSTHVVFGSDYDMDDDDYAFLVQLNSDGRTRGYSKGACGSDDLEEEGWAISADLFEGMIERLERQESRARDTNFLVEASRRLKKDHADATERVNQFIKMGDAVLNEAYGITKAKDKGTDCSAVRGASSRGGGRGSGTAVGPASGVNTNGNTSHARGGSSSSGNGDRRHGCGGGSSGRQRKKQTGGDEEDDSDSDDGEHQERIMRTRGPVTLTKTFALPLLRSCVMAMSSSSRVGSSTIGSGRAGARETATSRRAKGWKGKGKQPASRSGRGGRGDGEEEDERDGVSVSDDQLLEVFEYWAKKREAYGGPMLRCFHPFIMKLWRRMEDPVREAEDQEEEKDPHASPEAFETLKSFRQDLDKARLVVDCVKRREKLKRSAIRFANAYWKILDDTMDAPRPRTPRSSEPQVAAAPTVPSLLRTNARQSTRMTARATSGRVNNGGGGGGASSRGSGGSRSSGRAAAAAARAAVAAIATAEAMEEEDEYDPVVVVPEREHGGEGEGQEDMPPPPSLPAKSKGKAGGLAEQEQGWNIFAQLPTRDGPIPTPVPAADSVAPLPLPRLKKKGSELQRGEKEDRERPAGSRANPVRGLFVHRGVLPGEDDGDSCQQALSSRRLPRISGAHAVEVTEVARIPEAPHNRRSNNFRKTAAEATVEIIPEEKTNARARRRERFNSASSAALLKQQQSRRQQSSRQQPNRGRLLREPNPETDGADEKECDDDEVQVVVAPVAPGRSSGRGGGGPRGGSAGRRGIGGGHQPEEVKNARSDATTKRRRLASGPEDAEEEEAQQRTNKATKGRKATARGSEGSEREKRRRLEEKTNLDNGALSNGGQHLARSSSSSSSSSHHPSDSQRFKTRAGRSETAVVVVENVPSQKAALVLPGSESIKPTSRSRGRKSLCLP